MEEKLSLIEGEFNAFEANEILQNIYSTKINFHKMKNFSSQERYGIEDQTAIKRLPDLKLNLDVLNNIIANAERQNKKLRISSEIKIELLDE